MKDLRKMMTMLLSLLLILTLVGCGSSTEPAESEAEESSAEGASDVQGTDLKAVIKELYTSEDELELAGKYASTADIPDAAVDPELVGTWMNADGSMTYTFNEDGTAKSAMELYGESECTYTCFPCGDYKIIAEDLEMVEYSDQGETTSQVVSYFSYKVDNNALYLTAVESSDEFSQQSITQAMVFYKADESGDISASVSGNPVGVASFYGDWTYGDNEEGSFTIDENGITFDGEDTLPVAMNENGKLVIGDADDQTEYSAAIALERLYDNTDGKELTGENYALAISYTGEDEKDRPNLADFMDDWHSDYGYDQFYFSLNAKTPLN